HHQILHDVGAVVSSGFESERVHSRWQIEIVVDRLRYVHNVNTTRRAFFYFHRGKGRVVTADRQQTGDVQPQQRNHDILEVFGIRRWIRARNPDVRSASKMNAADRVDGQGRDVFDVALHQPLESLTNAHYIYTFHRSTNRCGADDSIDAWRWSAAY